MIIRFPFPLYRGPVLSGLSPFLIRLSSLQAAFQISCRSGSIVSGAIGIPYPSWSAVRLVVDAALLILLRGSAICFCLWSKSGPLPY